MSKENISTIQSIFDYIFNDKYINFDEINLSGILDGIITDVTDKSTE